MDKSVKDYVVQKVNDLMSAPTCCAEAKTAAKNWLDAVGTDKEAEQTKKLIEELEMDIMPIESLLAFAESEAGAKVFGEDKTKQVAAHARALQEAGEKYCDCPACAACAAILEKKAELSSL